MKIMNNFLKNYIHILVVILCLCNLCNKITNAFNITCDLEVICGLKHETNVIKTLPTECTALGVSTLSPRHLNDVNSTKGSLPFLIIDESGNYSTWPETVKLNAKETIQNYTESGINYVAYNYMYKNHMLMNTYRDTFSTDLIRFIGESKLLYPEVGFGMVLPADTKWLDSSLDLRKVNDHFDFFLLDSTSYRSCKHHDHQADMPDTASKEDIITSISTLKELGVSMSKLIYTIDLTVISVKPKFETSTWENMTYSILCTKKMSKKRKYCFNGVQCLFDKARLRQERNLTGIYVENIESDDVEGHCNCLTKIDTSPIFRGLKIIAGASRENVYNVTYYECTVGHYPVILD